MRIYNTEQRKLLLSFFEKYPDKDFTAKGIYEKTGGDISLSAVYRNLADLSSSGVIAKNAGEKREAVIVFRELPNVKIDFIFAARSVKKRFI